MSAAIFITAVEHAWRIRAVSPSGRRLTRLHVHVAAKLAFWRSAVARHRDLARAARCSTRTVRRALAVLHDLGLLSWTRRVVACRGWRAQVANSYALNASNLVSYQCLQSSADLAAPGISPAGNDLLAARRALVEERLRESRVFLKENTVSENPIYRTSTMAVGNLLDTRK